MRYMIFISMRAFIVTLMQSYLKQIQLWTCASKLAQGGKANE